MGCDGGSIPKRHELVKTQKAAERPDSRSLLLVAWFFCTLSKRPLEAPVVADMLGKLYNKDAVLEYLLNKGAFGDGDKICSHITSFKDVTTLNFTPNPTFTTKDIPNSIIVSATAEKPLVAQFICPVTQKEMNGKSRFSYIQTCGCVFSEQAFKEVPSTTCLKCGKEFGADDVVPINSSQPKEISRLQARVEVVKAERLREAEEKRAAKKAKKEGKKQKAITGAVSAGTEKVGTGSGSGSDGEEVGKKRKRTDDDAKAVAKKLAAAARSNINMNLPDLSEVGKPGSDAIKSLYCKKDKNGLVRQEGTYLTRGTFTRFAASF
ncbi:hypothetical protein HK097_010571 [Rhizophlyctis rosea]|uniref:Replication termination factor 2 n=1 Tax=Rhizophlyctis rosea TaxID=64517 RepID=A0AAD5SKN3_9FUNG|nr:hypothetical protein HK097_010571 [Rhizophlyctis rosea]